ncbi:class I SAM-dependent methyltransferase [Bradyrhizobium sp. 23]|uniref:class I SAM-dependent methyltransferase n=1 Tax=Bradyrhizobium sp. 23 TaxID=2782667 RepID=UPI001FFA7811|nr:class I SAM-dependent methyltransferase [Bradyrhizobium sp. 23]MCK1313390.1 methyltransferase domain-containing protein [Bradyrhizobium sp. 23]
MSLTTDLRRLQRPLRKIVCGRCGLASNETLHGAAAVLDYEQHYALNTSGGEEHIYFTAAGPVPRSQAILDWLRPHLGEAPAAVLEVGCGQGNLLARLADLFPHALVRGTEVSRPAVALARERGLHVVQQAVGSGCPPLPEADLIVCFGVLEHVEDPIGFLMALRLVSHHGGRAVIVVPIQEDGGYDLFFEDHVWHFTAHHLAAVARRAGWHPLTSESGHSIVQGFGLIVCEPTPAEHLDQPSNSGSPANAGHLQVANRDVWLARFNEVNRLLAKIGDGPLAVFGAGEVFGLLHTYTDLAHRPILQLIDDAAGRQGKGVQGIPVAGRDWLARHPEVPVFIAVHPRYHDQVKQTLGLIARRLVFWLEPE